MAKTKKGGTKKKNKKGGTKKSKKSKKKVAPVETAEQAAKRKVTEYYDKKKEFATRTKDIDSNRLAEDFQSVLREAGISKTRYEEDFSLNMRNLVEDKATDIEDINYYKEINTGRTQEDLDTALNREMRRYRLEYEKSEEQLGSQGLLYGSLGGIRGKAEEALDTEHQEKTTDVSTAARRSFQDIARYEAVKTAAVNRTYSRNVEEAAMKKNRGVQDVDLDIGNASTRQSRGLQDLSNKYEEDVYNLEALKGSDVMSIYNVFNEESASDKINSALSKYLS
jgi:hypothetical protein